jgi:hypothetical protein
VAIDNLHSSPIAGRSSRQTITLPSVEDYTMSQCMEDNANFKRVSKSQREDKWTTCFNMPSGLGQQLCYWY